ncbi:MAG: hypothetical protein KA253_01525 [Campylobacteraceae bacterium]|nr:hypothetical protein [Campylobacteraceae bacterium]
MTNNEKLYLKLKIQLDKNEKNQDLLRKLKNDTIKLREIEYLYQELLKKL